MTGAIVGKASSPDIVMNTVGAKAAWLSKLDMPSWGTKAGFMNPAPAAATIAASPSEDAAKAAWFAKLDVPAWGRAAAAPPRRWAKLEPRGPAGSAIRALCTAAAAGAGAANPEAALARGDTCSASEEPRSDRRRDQRCGRRHDWGRIV